MILDLLRRIGGSATRSSDELPNLEYVYRLNPRRLSRAPTTSSAPSRSSRSRRPVPPDRRSRVEGTSSASRRPSRARRLRRQACAGLRRKGHLGPAKGPGRRVLVSRTAGRAQARRGGGARAHHRILAASTRSSGDDKAFLEELLEPEEARCPRVQGMPDIRVIVCEGRPAMSMSGATLASAGRANLHQGAIGLASTWIRSHDPRGLSRAADRAAPGHGRALGGVAIPRGPGHRPGGPRHRGHRPRIPGVDVVIDRMRARSSSR